MNKYEYSQRKFHYLTQNSITKFVMPRLTRLQAACKRPSRVRNAAHRAEPMTVPLHEYNLVVVVEVFLFLFFGILFLPSMNNAGH